MWQKMVEMKNLEWVETAKPVKGKWGHLIYRRIERKKSYVLSNMHCFSTIVELIVLL